MDKFYEIVGHQVIFTVKGKKVEVDLRQAVWPISTFSLFYLIFLKKSGFQEKSLDKLLCQNEDEPSPEDQPYSPQEVNIPAISGWMVSLYRRIYRSPFGRSVMISSAKSQGNLDMFLKLSIPDKPTYFPIVMPDESFTKLAKDNEIVIESLIKPSEDGKFHFNTISDYNLAFRNKTATPLDIARKAIKAIKNSEVASSDGSRPRMRIMIEYHEEEIIRLASESTERWERNAPLSVFDGIPIAIKDEIFVAGYPCRGGLPMEEAGTLKTLQEEGWMVQKLRQGGAVFIGIANMHQLGIGVTGINQSQLHGTARNPVNPNYPPGGSSSGPAAAVAAGLCPMALGADGGGSIRIPSAVCGIVGAKVSYSRISGIGLREGCDTVGVPGGLCATVRDAAITYAFLAGKDPNYNLGQVQPIPTLLNFEETQLNGLKLGIDWSYFEDCIPEIREACKKGVNYLVENCGATVVEISIPEIQESVRAHVVCILSEMASYHKEVYHKHHDSINTETEVNLSIGASFTAEEYFKAQKQRTRIMNIFKRLFKTVDCIVTPGIGNFMPKLDDNMLEYGYFNLKHATEIMRFAPLGNFTGIPGITVPLSYSQAENLPIALQIMTPWWREDVMFRVAHAMEGAFELHKPHVYYDLIGGRLSDITSDDESE